MNEAFEINIIEQGWLEGCSAEEDLCSHGKISLSIGGVVIAGEEGEFGISESALAMLRTLESDHSTEEPIAERMVFHGCGTMLMMGCPIGIDWKVKHCGGGTVRLSDVVWYPETNEEFAVRYQGLTAELPLAEYRTQVTAFARKAEEVFLGVKKRIEDEFERKEYQDFWAEYNELAKEGTL